MHSLFLRVCAWIHEVSISCHKPGVWLIFPRPPAQRCTTVLSIGVQHA